MTPEHDAISAAAEPQPCRAPIPDSGGAPEEFN